MESRCGSLDVEGCKSCQVKGQSRVWADLGDLSGFKAKYKYVGCTHDRFRPLLKCGIPPIPRFGKLHKHIPKWPASIISKCGPSTAPIMFTAHNGRMWNEKPCIRFYAVPWPFPRPVRNSAQMHRVSIPHWTPSKQSCKSRQMS